MRILVVDDDDLAAEITAAVLEDGGCEVVMVDSAGRALQTLSDGKAFDMVISDMNMPGQSGLDLFRALRARGQDLPFILLSADDPQSLKQQEPRLAACVVKDCDLETTLMAAVAETLSPTG
jgi:CheY-like chemotaxis protein